MTWTMPQQGRRYMALGGLVALLLVGPGLATAGATASVGACCLSQSQCASLSEFDCDGQGGTFFGVNTSCAAVNCASLPASVPTLSILGLVAAVGALAALGLHRLVLRRRAW